MNQNDKTLIFIWIFMDFPLLTSAFYERLNDFR